MCSTGSDGDDESEVAECSRRVGDWDTCRAWAREVVEMVIAIATVLWLVSLFMDQGVGL